MFQGSMVALVTPMREDGSLDWDALGGLVEWHIEQGTAALVAVGTTGESPTLDMQEHLEVIRRTVDMANKRIPVIAGTGSNSTAEALELTQGAKNVKADACLLVTPYYNKPTQEGLYQHHAYLAREVAIPQILYNVPGRTAVDMLPETVARLSHLDHIVGIKEATGNLQRLKDIRALMAKDFLLLSGDDATALDFMELGGCGEISVTANVAPALVARMCAKALSGEWAEARAINERLIPLHRDLFLEANPIPVKWALAHMGRIAAGIRLPLTPLSERFHEPLRAAMQSAGVL